MTGDIRVNIGVIQQLATDIRSESTTMQTRLEDYDAQVQKLIGSWDGEAKNAYYESKNRWSAKIVEQNAILDRLGVTVDNAGLAYQATETANTRRFEA